MLFLHYIHETKVCEPIVGNSNSTKIMTVGPTQELSHMVSKLNHEDYQYKVSNLSLNAKVHKLYDTIVKFLFLF